MYFNDFWNISENPNVARIDLSHNSFFSATNIKTYFAKTDTFQNMISINPHKSSNCKQQEDDED